MIPAKKSPLTAGFNHDEIIGRVLFPLNYLLIR